MGISDVVAVLRLDAGQFKAEVGKAKAEMDGLGKSGASNFEKMGSIAGTAGLAIAAGVVTAGVASVALAEKFQSTTNAIAASADISTTSAKSTEATCQRSSSTQRTHGPDSTHCSLIGCGCEPPPPVAPPTRCVMSPSPPSSKRSPTPASQGRRSCCPVLLTNRRQAGNTMTIDPTPATTTTMMTTRQAKPSQRPGPDRDETQALPAMAENRR